MPASSKLLLPQEQQDLLLLATGEELVAKTLCVICPQFP